MKNRSKKNEIETAVFGGGCFWCLEAVFSRLKEVKKVVSGYAGGTGDAGGNPTYEDVCTGRTGHAEVVKVDFDPEKISYRELLSVFFAMHDPTTLNRQGADSGTQYRSIILYSKERQREAAEKFVSGLEKEKIFDGLIVTEIKPLEKFYPAEKYHQEYFENNTWKPYCQFNISPKIEKLKEKFQRFTK